MEHLVGKKINKDIMNAYGVTVIPAKSIINHESLRLLRSHRIDIDLISFSSNLQGNTNAESVALVRNTVSFTKEIFQSIKGSRKIPLMEIHKEVVPAIQEISRNTNVFNLFELVKAKDDYTFQHNIGVGVLSTLIGRWMNFSERDLTTLSLAATMHDVGKVKIPEELLNKPGKLTREEYEQVKKHTIYGYELLKETTGISHRVALVALQHHEREDGRGYPFGLKKDKVDLFSSIVAVADIFHAMSSKRPYHDPISFHEIIAQMGQGKFGELNPQIVSIFIENVINKMVGKEVVLTDGRVGEVVYLNPLEMNAPLIKIDEEFIDLSQDRDIHIQEIRG
ncbi:MAG: HD-GYP domain-containing protein [Paenibacillus sp.]|nr:HD-GYP domain-containing protein [Paenibacillus sp.]